jgi:hypothetical protein
MTVKLEWLGRLRENATDCGGPKPFPWPAPGIFPQTASSPESAPVRRNSIPRSASRQFAPSLRHPDEERLSQLLTRAGLFISFLGPAPRKRIVCTAKSDICETSAMKPLLIVDRSRERQGYYGSPRLSGSHLPFLLDLPGSAKFPHVGSIAQDLSPLQTRTAESSLKAALTSAPIVAARHRSRQEHSFLELPNAPEPSSHDFESCFPSRTR